MIEISSLETPCIVIDENIVKHNIATMAEFARQNGVQLRPHIKTHKIPEFALQQVSQGAVGITTAKVSEAEVMADHGISDIFIAYPIVAPSKIKRVIALAKRIRISIGVESMAAAEELSRQATEAGVTLQLRLEVDTGLARTGVAPHQALELAQQIAALPGLDLNGIFTFKGAVYKGSSTLDLEAAGLEEGRIMVETAEILQNAGLRIQHVSVGSSPTAIYAAKVEGVTEIRPGTYIFNDRMLTVMKACQIEECAAKVRVTIVSVPSPDRLVVDGGSKTFATDVQPNQPPLQLKGFGEIIGYPDAILERMNEEHGMIRTNSAHGLRVGQTLDIIPNHICSTVNLHNEVYITNEEEGIRTLAVLARGKLA